MTDPRGPLPKRSHVLMLLKAFESHGDRVAFDGERELTYGQLTPLVFKLARALAERGLRRGDGVVSLAANRPEMLLTQLAAQLIGCYYGGVPGVLSLPDQAALLADSGARALVFDPSQADRAGQLVERVPVEFTLSLGPGSLGDDLLHLAAATPADPMEPHGTDEEIAELVYTSGSTGCPKAAAFSFRVCAELTGFWLEQLGRDNVEAAVYRAPECRVLWSLPFLWLSGPTVQPSLLGGARFVVRRAPTPEETLRIIEDEEITVATMPPTGIYRLLDDPYLDKADLSRLALLVYHSAPATPARLREAAERIGAVLLQSYGQTETKMISALLPADHAAAGPGLLRSAGRPRRGVEVEIRDGSGRVLAPGAVGELYVRSRMIMDRYWRRPELTAQTRIDGWIRTMDAGYRDTGGYLYVLDRLRDVVIVDGINCYTLEIEEVLAGHQGVRKAAVVGLPDRRTGEAVHAGVVVAPGARVTAEELSSLVRTRKGAVYVPKTITFMEDIPVTPVGKPDKRALRAELARRGPAGE